MSLEVELIKHLVEKVDDVRSTLSDYVHRLNDNDREHKDIHNRIGEVKKAVNEVLEKVEDLDTAQLMKSAGNKCIKALPFAIRILSSLVGGGALLKLSGLSEALVKLIEMWNK